MYPLLLKPSIKDYLWGGTRLKTEYKMESDLEKVAVEEYAGESVSPLLFTLTKYGIFSPHIFSALSVVPVHIAEKAQRQYSSS